MAAVVTNTGTRNVLLTRDLHRGLARSRARIDDVLRGGSRLRICALRPNNPPSGERRLFFRLRRTGRGQAHAVRPQASATCATETDRENIPLDSSRWVE